MKTFSKLYVPLEILLAAAVITGIIMGMEWIISLSLILMALLYFLGMSIKPEDFDHSFSLIIGKVFGFSYAIAAISIMFRALRFGGADTFLIIGLSSLILSVFIGVIMMLSNNTLAVYLRPKIIRGIIYTAIVAVLRFFPGLQLTGDGTV